MRELNFKGRNSECSVSSTLNHCCDSVFYYISFMKALVITPKNDDEFKFLANLLKKLGVGVSALSQDEIEDMGMSKLMHGVDKSQKVDRAEIMKKLSV